MYCTLSRQLPLNFRPFTTEAQYVPYIFSLTAFLTTLFQLDYHILAVLLYFSFLLTFMTSRVDTITGPEPSRNLLRILFVFCCSASPQHLFYKCQCPSKFELPIACSMAQVNAMTLRNWHLQSSSPFIPRFIIYHCYMTNSLGLNGLSPMCIAMQSINGNQLNIASSSATSLRLTENNVGSLHVYLD